MAKVRHLRHAPIVEAMFDFRVRLPTSFDPKQFLALKKDLADKYSRVEAGRQISGKIEIKEGKPDLQKPSERIFGYRVFSKDKKEVAQFRLDGFTFSRLHPYTNWVSVFDEAKRLWEIYRLKAKPLALEKVGIRYINRIDVPMPTEFDDYLTAGPRLPKELPQETGQFFIKIVVQRDGLVANMVQTVIEGKKKGSAGIILDIDVSKVSTGGLDIDRVWPTFDQIRQFKNHIFFGLITEKSARLYE